MFFSLYYVNNMSCKYAIQPLGFKSIYLINYLSSMYLATSMYLSLDNHVFNRKQMNWQSKLAIALTFRTIVLRQSAYISKYRGLCVVYKTKIAAMVLVETC